MRAVTAGDVYLIGKFTDQGVEPPDIALRLGLYADQVLAVIDGPEAVPPTEDEQIQMVTAGKRCPHCERVLPLAMFGGRVGNRAGQLAGWCRDCDGKRAKTDAPARLIKNRARQRATAKLLRLHSSEFRDLMDTELAYAAAEAAGLLAKVAELELDHGDAPRLRPGPPKIGIDPEGPRLDLNWCPRCTAYHDAGHHLTAPVPKVQRPRRSGAELTAT